jgi:ribonuclease P protein component
MFARKNRLNNKEVAEIMKNGRFFVKTPVFSIKKINNLEDEIFKIAIVIPNKVEKSSVKRHFLKRKISLFLKEKINYFSEGKYVLYIRNGDFNEFVSEFNKKLFPIAEGINWV